MIFNKSFDDINFENVKDLLSKKITEGQNLEYKVNVWSRNDEGVREMLRDISAMSNGYGGYFVIGIEENNDEGIPVKIVNIEKAEEERDRIFSSCLVNLQPKISGMKIKCLSGEDKNVIVIHMPHSLRAPHLITFKGLNQFWIRHDRQKSVMSVEEIRDNFLKSSDITESAKSFIEKRKQEITEEIKGKPYYILGALPLGIYGEFVDISDTGLRERMKTPPNDRQDGWNLSFPHTQSYPSFYGLKIGGERGTIEEYKSLELHRNGYLESLVPISEDHWFIREIAELKGKKVPVIFGIPLIEVAYSFFNQLKQIKNYLGLETQYLIFCWILNVNGFGLRKYKPGTIGYDNYLKTWNKRELIIGNLAFEDIDPEKITKQIGDRIWQSFNYEGEPFFKDGKLEFKQQ